MALDQKMLYPGVEMEEEMELETMMQISLQRVSSPVLAVVLHLL